MPRPARPPSCPCSASTAPAPKPPAWPPARNRCWLPTVPRRITCGNWPASLSSAKPEILMSQGGSMTLPSPPSSPAPAPRPQTPMLDRVNSPADLKALSDRELAQLAHELRAETISAVSVTGGHLGAGLGVVELTVAL